jgi:hypothetical protein
MSIEEMRHCVRCEAITPHEVVTNKGIVALLCHSCFGRWANQPRPCEKRDDPRPNSSGRRTLWKHKPLR